MGPIELLQNTHKQHEAVRQARLQRNQGQGGPLGQEHNLVIGQYTTRTADPERMRRFYEETMGMTLVCVEDVKEYDFELYYFAYVHPHERPPHESPWSVENREWTYQRPYTTLEIQHRP